MGKIKFINDPYHYNDSSSFLAHISGIKSKNDLLEKIYNNLNFPDYFGFNWDALYECLRDFSWIKEKKIVLVHDDFPGLTKEILHVYLDILAHSVMNWQEGNENILEIIFPKTSESFVLEYLKKI
jgi:RNAse (barnase) inhibitor barstar